MMMMTLIAVTLAAVASTTTADSGASGSGAVIDSLESCNADCDTQKASVQALCKITCGNREANGDFVTTQTGGPGTSASIKEKSSRCAAAKKFAGLTASVHDYQRNEGCADMCIVSNFYARCSFAVSFVF
jgi:hypothetical protein